MNKPYNTEDIKVSVVIPVYNVEQWIGDCIESLKKQSLSGLEFIFVDDCGTDDSMRSVEEWAREDARVRIIRNETNMGAGLSRNRGIETAQGNYLSFVDPDDWVSDDFYEKLYGNSNDNRQDIVKGCRVQIDERNMHEKSGSGTMLKTNKSIKARSQNGRPLYTCFINEHTTAIYRSTLFHDTNVRYGSSRNSEDVTFLLKVCHQSENIAVIDDAFYYYRKRLRSATSEYTIDRSMEELRAMEESVDFFENKQISDHMINYMKSRIRPRLANYLKATQNDDISPKQQQEYVDRFRKLIDRLNRHSLLFRDYPELEAFLKNNRTATHKKIWRIIRNRIIR